MEDWKEPKIPTISILIKHKESFLEFYDLLVGEKFHVGEKFFDLHASSLLVRG